MLMHQLLLDGADRTPDKLTFWVDRDRALTDAEAVAAMNRMAGALHALRVRKGDRVSVFAHNGLDDFLALFGPGGSAPWRRSSTSSSPTPIPWAFSTRARCGVSRL